MVLGSDPY
jgi:hypothetical protein